MAKLFEEVCSGRGSGDMELLLLEEGASLELRDADVWRLRCHSLVLAQQPRFYELLCGRRQANSAGHARIHEVVVHEPRNEFLALIRFVYTTQIDIGRLNIVGLVVLANQYGVDEITDVCLKHIRENFSADVFFEFYSSKTINATLKERLSDQFMSSLQIRRNLCAITEDGRWQELPVQLVEAILSRDDLPIASETEVLSLIAQWVGTQRRSNNEMMQLLSAFRVQEGTLVRGSDLNVLIKAAGFEAFSAKEPRTGALVWDPGFVLHQNEAAGPQPLIGGSWPDGSDNPGDLWDAQADYAMTSHQLGAKDVLQQEPGWKQPGVHRCSISLKCTSWCHRERRLFRGSATSSPTLQKRAFEHHSHPSKSSGRERSPSPPPSFQVRMPPIEAFETWDLANISDGPEAVLANGVMRTLSQDKIDSEMVFHQIICGVFSGCQRHGVRFSQRERNAIFKVEDLNGGQSCRVGGTMSSVSFDLELQMGSASKFGISRCRFALLRNRHTLLEELFDVSARVPLRFYISSSYFDKSTAYTVSVNWEQPADQVCQRFDMSK